MPRSLKVVSESGVMWATSVPILVFLGISVLDLSPMYATDRQTDIRQTPDAHHRLMPLILGAGHKKSTRESGLFVVPTMHTTLYSGRLFRR